MQEDKTPWKYHRDAERNRGGSVTTMWSSLPIILFFVFIMLCGLFMAFAL